MQSDGLPVLFIVTIVTIIIFQASDMQEMANSWFAEKDAGNDFCLKECEATAAW